MINSSAEVYHLISWLEQNLGDHKYLDDREVETDGTMTDNTGHGLLSTGNTKFRHITWHKPQFCGGMR